METEQLGKRKEMRFLSNALVYVIDEANMEIEAKLSGLSRGGLSIKSTASITVTPNSTCMMVIVPEEETNLNKFRLEVESRWVKVKKAEMESGFSVLVKFDEKEFNDYIKYLSEKHGESTAS